MAASYFFMNGFDLSVEGVANAPQMIDFNDRLGEEPDAPHTHTRELPFPQPNGESKYLHNGHTYT